MSKNTSDYSSSAHARDDINEVLSQMVLDVDADIKLKGKCPKCSKDVNSKYVQAGKSFYHVDCFTCSKCSRFIQTKKYHLNKDKLICDYCFNPEFDLNDVPTETETQKSKISNCLGCGSGVSKGGKPAVLFDGKPWHKECLKCQRCAISLETSGKIFVKDSMPICKICNDNSNKSSTMTSKSSTSQNTQTTNSIGRNVQQQMKSSASGNAGTGANKVDFVQEIETLAELRDKGILSQKEFEDCKAEVLKKI